MSAFVKIGEVLKKIVLSKLLRPLYLFVGGLIITLFLLDSFIMPWVVNKGETLSVPNVVGMKQDDAFHLLDSMKLVPKIGDTRTDNTYPEGYVVAQNPMPLQIVKESRRIYLTISGGEQQAVVPLLRGRTIRDAKFALDRAGLRQGSIGYQVSTELPEGTIINQDVPGGAKIKRGAFISIVVSAGESIDSLIVPNLKGKSLSEAQRLLNEKGLRLGNITYQLNTELLPNTVIDQFPQEGVVVTTEKSVDVFIAQAPEKKRTEFE